MSIAIGLKDIDLRYDAIDLAFIPQEILGSDGVDNGEVHEAILIPGLGGKVGFSPNEMPERNSLANSGIILYEVDSSNIPIGSPLTQVTPAVGFNPGLTEYFVDIRNPLAFLNTGRFYLNPANVGKFYRIQRYFGLGGLNNVANQKFILDSVLATKLNIDGSNAMAGSLDFGSQKGINLANGTASSDAVNKGQLDALPNLSQLQKGFYSFVGTVASSETIATDAFVYKIISNLALSGQTINLTGCPNIDGTVIYFESVTVTGGASTYTLEIHGQAVATGIGGYGFQNVFASRISGVWKIKSNQTSVIP